MVSSSYMICDFFFHHYLESTQLKKNCMGWGKFMGNLIFFFICQESSEVKKKKMEMDHLVAKLGNKSIRCWALRHI